MSDDEALDNIKLYAAEGTSKVIVEVVDEGGASEVLLTLAETEMFADALLSLVEKIRMKEKAKRLAC